MKATGTSVVALGGLGSVTGSAAAQEVDLPPLARDGNKIVDPSGEEVRLRGVNIADPGEQSRKWRGQTASETFKLATNESEGWYSNVVRVPVMPAFLAAGTKNAKPWEMPHGDDWGPALPGQFDRDDVKWYCRTFLDELVELGAQRGAYVMIDYHRHYPVFHQEDHKNHGVPDNVWKCNSDGGEDWRHPEVCGERGVLWHGEDQVDEIWDLIHEQNILEAYDLEEDDIFLEPPEISNALDEELHMFWEIVASRYADDDHVIFDVYNEPNGPYGGDWGGPQRQAGELSAPAEAPGDGDASNYDVASEDMKAWYDLWVDRAQPWVDTVEENANGQLITIGSPRWSQYTYWAPHNEFDAENMCYTAHVYTQDDLRPLSKYFGQPSEYVPVFFSEFGWIEGGGMHVDTPWMDCSGKHDGDCEPYIQEYEEFIKNYDVHPLAWSFDHTYEPNMFEHGTPGQNDGAKGADDWMNYLNDETPGVWWHELNQEMADGYDDFAPGDEPYPDADNGENDLHIGPGDISGDPYPDDGGETISVGEYEARDLDGDGLYEDVNGNNETTHGDVNALFQNRDADGVQNNPKKFDFDGNGRFGFSDILELLEKI